MQHDYLNLNRVVAFLYFKTYIQSSMQLISEKADKFVQKIGRDNSAYLCWFIASVLWSLSFIFPNENKIDAFSSNLSRGVALVVFNGLGLYWKEFINGEGSSHSLLSSKQLTFVTVRHVLLSVYGFGFAQSQFYLSAPVVYTIYFSGPLFIMLIDYTYFKTTISKRQSVGIILTGAGVLLTANGQAMWAWVMNDNGFQTTFKNYKTDDFMVKSLVAFAMIGLTFGWACAQIMVREVKNKNHLSINFNFGIILTAFSSLAFMRDPENVINNDSLLFGKCLLFQGVTIAIAQAFFMGALLLSKKSGPITMIGFVGVVISYFISVIRYHEPLSAFCIIGAILALVEIFKTVMKD